MFKIGDRVRVINDMMADTTGSDVGREGTVVDLKGNPGFNAFVQLDGNIPDANDLVFSMTYGTPLGAQPFLDTELELVTNAG